MHAENQTYTDGQTHFRSQHTVWDLNQIEKAFNGAFTR